MISASEVFKLSGGLSDYEQQVCRMVETQEYSGSLSLVDNLEEQSVLELILDDYKPPYAEGSEKRHYLISSPFRYPPLEYGSRFAAAIEPSYFYASESIEACLAEAAFYRFMLIEGTISPYQKTITSKHDLFFVNAKSANTIDLCVIKQNTIQKELSHPCSYLVSQSIGKHCRDRGATLLRFYSARSKHQGINVAIDNHQVITSAVPINITPYICELDSQNEIVRFSAPRNFPVRFQKDQFEVNGQFPIVG